MNTELNAIISRCHLSTLPVDEQERTAENILNSISERVIAEALRILSPEKGSVLLDLIEQSKGDVATVQEFLKNSISNLDELTAFYTNETINSFNRLRA